MADIARIAGVSAITVSRALADSPLVTAETAARIRQVAIDQGYTYNVTARNLRMRSSRTVTVIVEMQPSSDRRMSDPYPLDLLGGISQELTSAGYSVLLTTLQNDPLPNARAADAVILLGQGAHEDAVDTIGGWHMPMAVWGSSDRHRNVVTVGSDNFHGGCLAAERLLALGRQRLVFLGDPAHAEVASRLAGFSQTLARHQAHALTANAEGFTIALGKSTTIALLERHPDIDGIFAVSDLLAIGAMQALGERGRRVPEEVSVIGYDNTPLGASYQPPLTTVHQNLYEGGLLLARKVLAMIVGENVASEQLPTHLVVRGT